MKYRHVGILSVGHLVTDINQGALPAMLPFFIAAHDLSYTAVAGIVFAANMASSVIQPVFGHAADRISKPLLLPVGLLLAGIGLAMTGMFQRYGCILSMAVISGIGIAAYHPEAAKLVNYAAGKKTGTAMSLFGVGGTVGFAIGPLIVTPALVQWGLPGALVLVVPAIIMALLLANQFSTLESLAVHRKVPDSAFDMKDAKNNWSAFSILTLTIVGRSIVFYGLNTFIPIYWINGLYQSKAAGAIALTIFAGSGIVGSLAGGSLADRIGQKKVMVTGFVGLTLFLPLLILTNHSQIATLSLVPVGFFLYGTYSPSIVLGQMYLPKRVGFSSGITLGVAVAIGGGAAPIIGKIADMYAIWHALAAVACFPVAILLTALSLPDPQRGYAINSVKTMKVVKNESV